MEQVNILQHERDALRKTLPDNRDAQNPEKITTLIEELQRRYETTTLKP